jgi:hypothetical protein
MSTNHFRKNKHASIRNKARLLYIGQNVLNMRIRPDLIARNMTVCREIPFLQGSIPGIL